jgi:hypothetical protein
VLYAVVVVVGVLLDADDVVVDLLLPVFLLLLKRKLIELRLNVSFSIIDEFKMF